MPATIKTVPGTVLNPPTPRTLKHQLCPSVAPTPPRDPGKSENAWFLRVTHPGGWVPFEFLKMHLYQYTQKMKHCSNKFDFLPLFCLEGLVPNSVLSGSRGVHARTELVLQGSRTGRIPPRPINCANQRPVSTWARAAACCPPAHLLLRRQRNRQSRVP